MALVVFMRGANVGGRRTFQPSQLAKELSDFGVVNVGAAGTFVVRKAKSQATLRDEFTRRLPFATELMICRGSDLLDLAHRNPFPVGLPYKDARPFVSVIGNLPRKLPPLPIEQPAGGKWQVKIVGVSGRFVLSFWRRLGRTLVYPNEVVEKKFGVPATTRNWDTITAICRLLEDPS